MRTKIEQEYNSPGNSNSGKTLLDKFSRSAPIRKFNAVAHSAVDDQHLESFFDNLNQIVRHNTEQGIQETSASETGEEGSVVREFELLGYREKRKDFEEPYCTKAESYIENMEFEAGRHDLILDDTEEERRLKMEALQLYNQLIDQRENRVNFAIKHGLLDVEKIIADASKKTEEENKVLKEIAKYRRLFPDSQMFEEFGMNILKARNVKRKLDILAKFKQNDSLEDVEVLKNLISARTFRKT